MKKDVIGRFKILKNGIDEYFIQEEEHFLCFRWWSYILDGCRYDPCRATFNSFQDALDRIISIYKERETARLKEEIVAERIIDLATIKNIHFFEDN